MPRAARISAAAAAPLVLAGCDAVILSPAGEVARQQRNLILQSTGLMLLIIVPVIVLTLFFARKYRQGNKDAVYDPEWHHSTQLEVAIWSAPLAIIIALGAITWLSTHTLDPYRQLTHADSAHPFPPSAKRLNIQVVALDWKWLFFYPDLNIATVNEVAAPVDTPISFKLTSATVMNSFFVPALAGQIFTMAGMETQLHAVINREGVYKGFSANYSGSGFSRMDFNFRGLTPAGFDRWVAQAKQSGKRLDRAAYEQLAQPSEAVPVIYFASYENGLYNAILNMCVRSGSICMSTMSEIDRNGGVAGEAARDNWERLQYDMPRGEEGRVAPAATYPATGRPAESSEQAPGVLPRPTEPGHSRAVSPPDPGAHAPGNPAPPQLNAPPTRPNQTH